MSVQSYRDLIAWQKAMDLVECVYRVTRCFPTDERFGLTNQVRRAAVSIPSNIAEGQGRSATADYVRFLRIARGSQQEVETQLLIANRLGYLDDATMTPCIGLCHEVGRLLGGLIRALDD